MQVFGLIAGSAGMGWGGRREKAVKKWRKSHKTPPFLELIKNGVIL
jgi:hypothetical protein